MIKYIIIGMILLMIGCSTPIPDNVSDAVTEICKIKGNSECHGDCMDGFGADCYYDSTKYSELEGGISLPEETKNACMGIHSNSVCGSCYNRFELRKNNILEKVSCEEFFQAIEDKNKECKNCVDSITSGCC